MDESGTLRHNLERLRARHPRVASRVEQASGDAVEVLPCRNGARTLACEGVLLASRHDPAREGERIASDVVAQGTDLWIAIGFSLGHQVDAARRERRMPLVMFEPAPERLRGALALRRDLDWIEDPDVCFAASPDEVADEVARRYLPGLKLHVTVHPSAWRLAPDSVRATVDRIRRVKDAIDVTAATRVGQTGAWTWQTIENAPRYAPLPSFSRLRGAFRGRPAIVASAGPSLDKQLPLLAQVGDRALLFAVGPSLGALRTAGIEPDFVHVLEASDVAHQLERSGPTADLNLVLTPKVHPRVFDLPARHRFVAYTASERFAWWIAEQLGEERAISSAGSVAMGSVLLAAELGADPILLVGQDLAFSGGRVYAGGSCYERIGFEPGADGIFRYTNMQERIDAYGGDKARMERISHQQLVWVEGWDGEPVPTSVAYASFREGYRAVAEELARKGSRLINCTEGGARIPALPQRQFADALEEFATQPFEKAATIQRAADTPSRTVDVDFGAAIRRERNRLRCIERDARQGTRDVEAAQRRLRSGGDPRLLAGPLRRVRRAEQAVGEGLERTPWLDSLVQAELHAALPMLHRAERSEPTPEQALEECLALLRAVLSGCERAGALFDRLREKVADG